MQAFVILIGEGHHLETAAGFTSWRLMTTTAVIGAIWALRTSTGLLRGEEDHRSLRIVSGARPAPDAPRLKSCSVWECHCSPCSSPPQWVSCWRRVLPAPGFPIDLGFLFALSLVSSAAMFLAIGTLTSQLAANSGQATMLGSAVLGLAYVVRLAADANASLGWLRWASPLGWMRELSPLRDPQLIALVPMSALIAGCCVSRSCSPADAT